MRKKGRLEKSEMRMEHKRVRARDDMRTGEKAGKKGSRMQKEGESENGWKNVERAREKVESNDELQAEATSTSASARSQPAAHCICTVAAEAFLQCDIFT